MDYSLIKTGAIVFFYLYHASNEASAGGYYPANPDSTDLYSIVQKEYGPVQVLMNGFYPEDYVVEVLGHPFLDDNFLPGYVIVYGQKFDHLFLKYNVFEQNIVVSMTGEEKSPLQVIPPHAVLSEFYLSGRIFRKLSLEVNNDRFFQVVYNGKIKFLVSFQKNRYQSFHNPKYSSYIFSDLIKNSWVLMGQKLYAVKTVRSFLSLFPKETRSGIRAYCRNEKVRLTKSGDQKIQQLMKICEDKLVGTESINYK